MRQGSSFKEDGTISFAEKLAASEQFSALFTEGMDLVSAAAAYLDGEGREDSRRLPRAAALRYAVESMRLTTRLMQIASWLLLQRAVKEGELSRAEACAEKRRIHLTRQEATSSEEGFARLPARLCELVAMSLRVQARVIHLDQLFYSAREGRVTGGVKPSPVAGQIEQLRAAFTGGAAAG